MSAVLSTSVAFGVSNSWNPVGWFILGSIVIAVVCVTVSYGVHSSKNRAQASTKNRTLSDVKVRQQSGKHYYLAYISYYGQMIKVGRKLSFSEALGALGVTGATNSIRQRIRYNRNRSSSAQRQLEHKGSGNWGIYADSQSAAKALAVVFVWNAPPEVHSAGMYGHYHDITHTFHIWYGGVIWY